MFYRFFKSISLTWTSRQARDWKVIRCQLDPTHLTMTSISPRMTWTRSTSSHPRPSQGTSKTVGQREHLVLCSLALMSKAKHLWDPAEKHLPSETAAAVAHITVKNLKEKMCLVSIRRFGHIPQVFCFPNSPSVCFWDKHFVLSPTVLCIAHFCIIWTLDRLN